MAGFCNWVDGLLTPYSEKSEPNFPKVSGRYREYSHFRDTIAGDCVRSPLRDAGCSCIRQFLRSELEGSENITTTTRVRVFDPVIGVLRRGGLRSSGTPQLCLP